MRGIRELSGSQTSDGLPFFICSFWQRFSLESATQKRSARFWFWGLGVSGEKGGRFLFLGLCQRAAHTLVQ